MCSKTMVLSYPDVLYHPLILSYSSLHLSAPMSLAIFHVFLYIWGLWNHIVKGPFNMLWESLWYQMPSLLGTLGWLMKEAKLINLNF